MTSLEPDLRDAVPPTTTVDPSQLVAPELPEIDLTQRYEANLAGQRPSSFPMPAGARVDTTAIVPNLPDAQTAFSRKYARLGPALASLPGPVRASLVKLDMQRVNKGQYPLSDKETLAAVLAATRKKPTTEAAQKDSPLEFITDLPGAAVRDLTAVARSLPSLLMPTEANPLWQELTSLDDIPEKIQESLDSGDNIVTAVANAPGIRFIPGSYVVGNLADGTEGMKELANHPGLAILDILPYAGKAAKLTKVGRIAAEERGAYAFQAERLAQINRGAAPEVAEAAAARYAARKAGAHPIWDVMTKRVAQADDARPVLADADAARAAMPDVADATRPAPSALEPNILGRQFAKAGEAKPGQFFQAAFGRDSRYLSGMFVGADQRFIDARTGNTALPEGKVLERTARKAREAHLRAEELIPDEARRAEISSEAAIGRPGWRERLNLTEAEQTFADEMRAIGDEFRQNAIDRAEVGVDPLTGEVYNASRLRKINNARAQKDASVQRLVAKTRSRVEAEYQAARERFLQLTDERAKKGAWKRGVARELRQARDDMKRMDTLRQLIDEVADGRATVADLGRAWGNMKRRPTSMASPGATGKTNVPADAVSKVGTVVNLDRWIAKAKKSEDALAKMTDAPPDRWTGAVTQKAEQVMVDRLVAQGVDSADAFEAVANRSFDAVPGFSKNEWQKIVHSAAPLWKELKEQGFDPQFVPTLARGQEGKFWAGLSTKNRGLSITKDRALGAEAAQWGDMSVAYDAAAADMLRDALQREVLNEVGAIFGRSWEQVVESYLPRARQRVEANPARLRSQGERAVREEAEAMAKERWAEWAPDNLGPQWRGDLNAEGRVYIPRHLMKVAEDSTTSRYGALNMLDPLTGTFRISVLALSPRWHVYNIVGNALMLAGTEGPQAVRYAWEARKIIKAARRGEDILPERIRVSLESGARDLADDTAFMQTVEGARLRRMMESLPARTGRKWVNTSYRINGFFDDTTKVMAFESGKRRAMRRGWAPDAAERAGLEAAQRASAFWVEMTPFERGVLRKVFPFYTFTKKIMGLTLQMPLDHPVRTAILANLAAAEMEDMGEGLPLDWLNSLPIGEPDAQGNQTRVSMSGLNPFSDAPSMFTLKGFLSGLNPAFNTVLVQMGATEAGGPLMFGDRTYDPQTGKLVTPAPNPLSSLLTSTIPQVGSIYRGLGLDAGFNELARNNPDAAGRMLVGGLGFPTSIRTMNESEQRMKSELARITAQRDAWRNALATGDYSEAQNYPALRPLIAQVQALSKAGLMDQYHPYTKAPTVREALSSQAPWPT